MKLSLGGVSALAFSLGLVAIAGIAACADSESQGDPAPLDGGHDSAPPVTEKDAEVPPPDASRRPDSGPKDCSDHGFCPTTVPDGRSIVALWGDGTGVMWAGTTEGDLLRWDKTAWNVHASKLGPIQAIWGSGPTDVWVAGEDGIQHGTGETAATLTFAPSELPGGAKPIAGIGGTSASDVWAVGSGYDPDFNMVGYAYHFSGTPGAWQLDPSVPTTILYERVFVGVSGLWLGGPQPISPEESWVKRASLAHRTGDGTFANYMLPADPDPELLEHEREAILAGAILTSNASVTFYGQPMSEFNRAYLWRGTSTDNGKTFSFTWEADKRSARPPINQIVGTAANDVWAAGNYGRLNHWNGTAWSTTAISVTGLPVTDPLLSVWARGSDEIWVGGKGIALRFDPTKEKNGGVP